MKKRKPPTNNSLLNFFTQTPEWSRWLVVFVGIAFLTYWRLFFHFFEQDEWMGLGLTYGKELGVIAESGILNALVFAQGRPLTQIFNTFFYLAFGFNLIPLTIFSITLHGLTGFSLFLVLQKIRSAKYVNFAAVVIFLINITSHQAVTWFAASISVPLATCLLLVSILFFLYYLSTNRRDQLILSIFLFYLSFLTKEMNALFSFFYIFLFYLQRGGNWRSNLKTTSFFLVITCTTLLRYLHYFFLSSEASGIMVKQSTANNSGLEVLFKNIISAPLATVSQLFIPAPFLFGWGYKINTLLFHGKYSAPYVELSLSLVLSVILTFGLLAVGVFLLVRGYLRWQNVIIGGFFYFLALLPLTIIQKGNAYMESRYVYLPLVGIAIILAGLELKKRSVKVLAGTLIFFLLFITFQSTQIQSYLKEKTVVSMQRRTMVEQFQAQNISSKKINFFYVSSKEDFIIPNQKLPFQQGVGYTLMVIYYSQGVIPQSLLSQGFMWDLSSQGYFSDGEYGFGYFYELEALKAAAQSLSPERYNLLRIDYSNKQLYITPAQLRSL
ncbi:MAG: hypothetical protein SGJ02_06475 [bacterium]|nr:hypothetical protein [bacterium]